MDIKKILLASFLLFSNLKSILIRYGNRRFDIFKEGNKWIIASETKDGVEIARRAYEFGSNFLVDVALTKGIAEDFKKDFNNFQIQRTYNKVKEVLRQATLSFFDYVDISQFNSFKEMIEFAFKDPRLINEINRKLREEIEGYIETPYKRIFGNEKIGVYALVGLIENSGIKLEKKINSIDLRNYRFILGDLIKTYPYIGKHTIDLERNYPDINHEDIIKLWKEHPGDWLYNMFEKYIEKNPKYIKWEKECERKKEDLIERIENEKKLEIKFIYDPKRFYKLPW